MPFITKDTPSSERSSNSKLFTGVPTVNGQPTQDLDNSPQFRGSPFVLHLGIHFGAGTNWSTGTGGEFVYAGCFLQSAVNTQLKPDYSHPSYSLEQVDPAKRNLLQAPAQKPQLSSQTWRKVCNLGNPYELPMDEGASTSWTKGRDSAASLLYLSSRASAPFFAVAITDANMTLSFQEEEEQDQKLGLACRAPPKEAPRPYILVLKSLKTNIR